MADELPTKDEITIDVIDVSEERGALLDYYVQRCIALRANLRVMTKRAIEAETRNEAYVNTISEQTEELANFRATYYEPETQEDAINGVVSS
ncbi:hypothetical protein A7M48_21425 [Acinetobacter baumannii]|nr:hypothetical protein A7M48_21425 [Acinetobacter baumannii]